MILELLTSSEPALPEFINHFNISDIACFPNLVKVSEYTLLLLNTDLQFKQIMSILYEFVDYVNI